MNEENKISTAEQLVVSEFLQMKEELKDLRERNENLTSRLNYLLDRNMKLRKAIHGLEPYRNESGLICFHNGFLSKYDEAFKFFDEYLRKFEEEEKARKGTEKLVKAIFKEDEEEEDEDEEENEEKKEHE